MNPKRSECVCDATTPTSHGINELPIPAEPKNRAASHVASFLKIAASHVTEIEYCGPQPSPASSAPACSTTGVCAKATSATPTVVSAKPPTQSVNCEKCFSANGTRNRA